MRVGRRMMKEVYERGNGDNAKKKKQKRDKWERVDKGNR